MTDTSIQAEDVARYLGEHPGFFERHTELLAALTLPHPHGGRAISLQERQVEVLRERHRLLELRLADLLRIAEENDAIGAKFQKWTRELLLTEDVLGLPDVVVGGLSTVFSVPQVAMRLWGLRPDCAGHDCARAVSEDVISLANGMSQPFCGPNSDFQAATWLPDAGKDTRSIALLPLRKGIDPRAFGLIVLGSADPERFRSGMGTAYLERIAEMASAGLSRLVD
jgi:uncharacterized protein YigA (DUF484 family)